MKAEHEASPSSVVLRNVFSRLTDAAWSVSHQFKRISEFVQGHAGLSQSCAWLMGTHYGSVQSPGSQETLTPEDQDKLLQDFKSRVWCTYRRDFTPLGPDRLVGDVGWGCTIRTGQMMMAEVLSRHMLGRGWRRGYSLNPLEAEDAFCRLLSLFLDQPQACLSIHQICVAGQSHGMVPGKWLGPWVLCKGLASLVNNTPQLGLRMHVVCDPGGGAPSLDAAHLLSLVGCKTPDTAQRGEQASSAQPAAATQPLCADVQQTDSGQPALASQATTQEEQLPRGSAAVPCPGPQRADGMAALSDQPDAAPGADRDQASLVQAHTAADADPLLAQGNGCVEDACSKVALPCASGGHGADATGDNGGRSADGTCGNGDAVVQQPGLVLLLPLTLGVGRANALYYPQLLQVLTFPQSVGIVGGRPSASLYFIGHQDNNLLYLDPHIPQPAGTLPAALPTYFCDTVRLMPTSSIDPSLAIGFYCRGADEVKDLITRLDNLAVEHRKAPLVTVADLSAGASKRAGFSCCSSPPSRQGSSVEETWEMANRTSAEMPSRGGHKQPEELESWEVL